MRRAISSRRAVAAFAAIAILGVSADAVHATLTNRYTLDDASTANGAVADDSVGTRDGTYNGNITSVSGADGGADKAAHFDGTADGILLTDASTPLLGGLTNFTLVTLFSPDSGYSTGDRFLYDESDRSDADRRPVMLLRFTDNGKLQFGIFRLGGFIFATINLSANQLTLGAWYYAGAVLSSTTGMSVYLFNSSHQLVGSATNANTLPTDRLTSNATIGAWTGANGFAGPQNSFIGTIDDVEMWNHAMTQAEVQAVPEPSSILLLSCSAAAFAATRRRRR